MFAGFWFLALCDRFLGASRGWPSHHQQLSWEVVGSVAGLLLQAPVASLNPAGAGRHEPQRPRRCTLDVGCYRGVRRGCFVRPHCRLGPSRACCCKLQWPSWGSHHWGSVVGCGKLQWPRGATRHWVAMWSVGSVAGCCKLQWLRCFTRAMGCQRGPS